jgi:hypothetical protein
MPHIDDKFGIWARFDGEIQTPFNLSTDRTTRGNKLELGHFILRKISWVKPSIMMVIMVGKLPHEP